jgi:hypothetical protein
MAAYELVGDPARGTLRITMSVTRVIPALGSQFASVYDGIVGQGDDVQDG